MAYADKVTNMRRVALLRRGCHNVILWEGVEIEGKLLIREAGMYGENVVACIDSDRVEDWLYQNELDIVYQDPETDEAWEPRLGAEL